MRRFAVPSLLVLALATAALAATLQEVTDDADALILVYEDLEDRVDNCPGGTCQEAQDIVDDFDDAELDLTQLHSDRASLNPCGACMSVDATIDDIDGLSVSLAGTLGGWDEGS